MTPQILTILYIFVAACVMTLFMGLPLFPFWKVWQRLKTHHWDLWMAKGPFDIWNLTSHPELVRGFLDIVALADKDETLIKSDPYLVKWTKIAREVWKMMPRSFMGQLGVALVFLYFVWFFTSSIVGAIYSVAR
ncbi:MAG: hypothetical protein PSY14_12670 [bacterium]|nr:hypothetical protein [bacterium]